MRWPAEALWEQLAPALPGFTVEVLPQLDSTNSELMRRARAGATAPILLVAEQQTAGRGRGGKAWHAEPGASLTFSLGMQLQPADWSGLSLAVGVAIAGALHPDVRLKWPNDLWVVGDRKLGGILIETASTAAPGRFAIVGVGLNIAPRRSEGFSVAPAALHELRPDVDAPAALGLVVPPLVEAMRRFESAGFAPFEPRFRALDLLAGRPVVLSDGTSGSAAGVSGSGELLVHTAAGPVAVTSSEVSVRPA